MQHFRIIATEKQAELLREILRGCSAEESPDADCAIVESGCALPGKGLAIVFRPDDLPALVRLLNDLSGKGGELTVLIGRKHETYEPIQPEQILFFKADGNSLYAHTEKLKYEMKQKLFEIERMIPGRNFIRVNKSYIVNILKVREIVPWFGGRLLLRMNGSDEHIEVSRNYVKGFKLFLGM